MRDWQEKGSPWELWVEKGETVREHFASLIGAYSDEVAVCTSVSAAISALASSLDFSGDRNKIVVSDFEFPTATQVWHAQESRGAQVVHVPASGNTIPSRTVCRSHRRAHKNRLNYTRLLSQRG